MRPSGPDWSLYQDVNLSQSLKGPGIPEPLRVNADELDGHVNRERRTPSTTSALTKTEHLDMAWGPLLHLIPDPNQGSP